MHFQLPISLPVSPALIQHQDKIMLLGSCFTEHIGNRLSASKFTVRSNPNGILFNPLSVSESLRGYLQGGAFLDEWMFETQEVWHHWKFHSSFSSVDRRRAQSEMEASVRSAAAFLKDARWLIITLGSAFQYFLMPGKCGNKEILPVANCHRAPATWFERQLLSVSLMKKEYDELMETLKRNLPELRVIFTVSPVRHIREGLAENNRSKARLIELVHYLKDKHANVFYFPAYELVIDVLRDYRFYDIDLVHPNYAATNFVWEQFIQVFLAAETRQLLEAINEIRIAVGHQPRFPKTRAHQQFKAAYIEKIRALSARYPYLDWCKEIAHFQR